MATETPLVVFVYSPFNYSLHTALNQKILPLGGEDTDRVEVVDYW